MESITGSRTVIDILNRLGDSISYTTIEELETELIFVKSNRELITPTRMNLAANLATDVAFNNFDRFVETLSGKDTLHEIAEIAYQLSTEEIESSDKYPFPQKTGREEIPDVDLEVKLVNKSQSLTHQNLPECSVSKNSQSRKNKGKRLRRAYKAKGTDIAPYRIKRKACVCIFHQIFIF